MTALEDLSGHLASELVVVDIGCRWGFAPHWKALGSYVTLYGFDADEIEISRLDEEFADVPRMHFFARALGSQSGHGTLMLTAEPGSTSLFPRSSARLGHIPEYDGARVTSETDVVVSTLDQWRDEEGVGRIDSLKLDTQGSELDILRGAVRSLATARHVEVEVAFNELFEGAPLFADVDTFLRGQGFALWRFRDLVHHALHEAPDPPPVTEYVWYESKPQSLTGQGGQLMWCNAHFVRRDVYAPEPSLGWQTRLRDACLMSALQFHDLAVLALGRLVLEPGCPDLVRASAERVRAGVAAARSTAPAKRATLAGRLRVLRRGVLGLSDQEPN